MEFKPFPKIPRMTRPVVVTEKIDGTNAQIFIEHTALVDRADPNILAESEEGLVMYAGSRNRWLTKNADNYGFANWALENYIELFKLGPGQHFGEWWGLGIGRNYGLKEKRFSLFNTKRWGQKYEARLAGHDVKDFPACCHVVPTLGTFTFETAEVSNIIEKLRKAGSVAAPGFMQPEGIIVFHTASGEMFKKTLDKDEQPKGQLDAS